jgi:hypothetical protein
MGLGIRSMVPVYKIRRGPSATEKAAEHTLCDDRLTGAPGRSLYKPPGAEEADQSNRSKLSKLFVAENFLTIDRKIGQQRTPEPSLL